MRNLGLHLVASVLVLCLYSIAATHGIEPVKAPDGWQQPALIAKGGQKLAQALNEHASGLLTSDELDLLQKATEAYGAAHALEAREDASRDAAYNRFLADSALEELVSSMDQRVVFDFRSGAPSPGPDDFLGVAGSEASLLLEIITGDEGHRFAVHHHDLRDQTELTRSFPVTIAPGGTTWMLLRLSGIPAGKSIHHIGFVNDGDTEPSLWHAVFLERKPLGQLSVSITDHQGAPVPALVRLRQAETNALMEPAGALDMRPIMNDLSGEQLSAEYPKGFPWHSLGPAKGWYWIVPGGFSMAVPTGKWEVSVYRGLEYTLHVTQVTVSAAEPASIDVTPERWTNMPERGWYSGDDHVHAQMMSDADAEKILTFAMATDTHVSNVLEMGNAQRTWYTQRGFGPDFRYRKGIYTLVPGQEDPRYRMGHAIGLNLTSLARDLNRYMLNDWVADEVHRQGGLYGHAHVGHKAFDIIRDMTMLIPQSKSDFSTIMQGFLGTDYYYDFLDLGYKHPASAGTDVPYGSSIGAVRVYCYTGDQEKLDVDAWFAALGAGRSFVTMGPMIELTVNDKIPGAEIVVEENAMLQVKARAWGRPGSFAPAELKLVALSEEIATETVTNPDAAEVLLEREISAGNGFWLIARVRDAAGAEAHTSPIYVRRKGMRHWNYDRVPQIVSARMETLNEIEGMVAEQVEKYEAGQTWTMDFWSRWVVEQAPEVRERITHVRGLYTELLDVHETEKNRRLEAAAN